MLTLLKTSDVKENFGQLKEMLKLLLPKGKSEIILFIVFFLIYGTLATFIALGTNITDRPGIITDAYFFFDNTMMSHHRVSNMTHPLLFVFILPLQIIGIILNIIFSTAKAKALFLVLFCTYLVTSSILYVFRYLKEIINIDKLGLYLITNIYAFSSTIMILSFTFESYPFSIYFLSFTIYYYSYNIKTNNKIPFINSLFLAISLGGITITNLLKGLIPIIFTNDNYKSIIKKILTIGSIALCVSFAVQIMESPVYEIQSRIENFTTTPDNVSKYIIDLLFGAPILFPNIKTYHWTTTISLIITDFYNYWWQYITITIIAFLSLLGAIANYKQRLIYIPILFISIDIIIHVIVKYGIINAIIFGGHWVFIVPILIGWLYKSLGAKQQKMLSFVFSLLLLVLCINNIFQMSNFIKLALKLFPVN